MQILHTPYKKLQEHKYLLLVTFLIPALNFLNGILIDMYTPSMPQIAIDLHTTSVLVKNTVTATILGYGIGSIALGAIFDIWGRRVITIVSLFLFIITSIFAIICHNIEALIIIRFIQGLIGSVMSIGSRVLAMDHFKDKRLTIVILYASLAFGIGTVIGPFIGGYLQYHFGWHANFYVFLLSSLIMFVLYVLFVEERYNKKEDLSIKNIAKSYVSLFSNIKYLAGLGILSIVQFELLFYPTVGSFVVEHRLGYSAITFGNSSVFVGLGYLLGTFSNRILLKKYSQKHLITLGIKMSIIALICTLILAIVSNLSLWSFVLPIAVIAYSVGFILGNVSSTCLQVLPEHGSIVASINASTMMILSGFACFIVSHISIHSLFEVFLIFLPLILLKHILFSRYFQGIFNEQQQ